MVIYLKISACLFPENQGVIKMRSRIIPILLSVMLFFSCVFTVGFFGKGGAFFEMHNNEKKEAVETEIHTFNDIPYGQHKNQTFDLNLPVDSRDEIGLVLFLHGGGWISGDKSAARDSYEVHKANKNYATASINYRFINDGESNVSDIIDDITLALNQLKIFASSYNMNITKVILCGHSAGGHLSMLYAYKYKDISPIEPVGVFASAPVPDLSLDSFFTNNVLGDEKYMCNFISQLCGKKFTPKTRAKNKEILDEYSPINYVSRSTVPTLVIHGRWDRIAPFAGSQLLMKKLSKYSVNHELIIFENTGHGLKNNEDKNQYASDLMLACAKEWFNITDNNQ